MLGVNLQNGIVFNDSSQASKWVSIIQYSMVCEHVNIYSGLAQQTQ